MTVKERFWLIAALAIGMLALTTFWGFIFSFIFGLFG